MKKIRKISALLMALCMVLCVGAAAFTAGAVDTVRYSDAPYVLITKAYNLEGSGISPAETFTLEQIGDGVVADGEAKTAPALGTITGASFDEGDASANGTEARIRVDLPEYDRVGVYEYTLREVAGTTAGVTYYANDIKLVVTVINDDATGKLRIAAVHTESVGEAKNDRFANTYSAGTLNITKTVTGNLGDRTRYFKFTVTLTGERGKNYRETYAVSGGSYENNPTAVVIGEAATFYLKHDETLSIENLPYGVTYTVEEDTPDDYTLTAEGASGTIGAASADAAFTNNKGGTPDTGIMLDSIPYIAILLLVAVGAFVLIARKRSAEDC